MSENTTPEPDPRTKLISITLDVASIARADPKIDHERDVAIFDLLESNYFSVEGHETDGPYRLHLSIESDSLVMSINNKGQESVAAPTLSLRPFRRILKDYFLVLESYYKAVSEAQPGKIEAIDVGRRGLHDEGSRLLMERLAGKIKIDFDTARRLFTLLAALHWRG